ncbi:uncharacterized protein LOC106162002 [Lingula anatina]|uniref:Uncharacterized protein LOC106162002 n=1 Tax=Lingula anatina TaxID=7574 RepID=A0A1S3I8M9_LINAN|nr:uncharacterized protein LOC106162002 [Lingula anatina]|eukprot:XP_013394548.1 uncharacterized protein LOC106162002 [Lingula anatina]
MIPLNPMINSIPDWSPPPKKKKKATKSKKQKTSSSAASVNLTNVQASKLPPESHSTTEKVANSSNGNNLSGTVASSSSRSSAKSSKIEEEKDEATIMNKVKEILGKAQLEQQMEIARKAQQLNAQGEEGIGKSKQCVVSSTVSTVVQAPSTNVTAVTVASSSGTSQCASGAHFAGAERPEKGAEEGSRHYEQAAGGGVKPFDVQLGQKQFSLDSPHPSIASKPELVPSSSSSLSSSSSSELPQNGQYVVSTADTQQNQQKHGSHNSDQISSVEMCTGASMLQVPASEVGNKGEFPVGFSAQEASPQHQQQQHLLHQQQQHLIYFQQAQQNQQQQLLQHISPVNLNQIPASMELGSVENDGGVNPSGRHISSPPSQPVRNRSHSFSSQPIMSPGRRSQSATPASSSRTTPLSMPSPGPMSPTGNVFPFPLNPNQVQGHPMFMGQGYMSAAGGPGPHLMHQFQNFPPQGIPPHGPWGLPDLQQMALLSPYQQQPDQGQSTGKKSAKGKGKKGNQNQNKNHQAMVMGPNMIPHQFQPQRFGVGFSTTAAGAAGNVKNMHQQSGFPPQPSNTGGSFPASQFLSAAARAQGQVQAHPMQGHQGQPTQGQPHMMMMANNNPQQQQQQQMMMQHLQDMPMNRMPMNHPQQIRPNMPMTFPPNNMMQGQRFPIGMQVHAPQMMMPMQSNPPNNKKQRGANKIASPNPMGPRATSSPKMAADNRVFNFPAAIPLGNVPSQEGGGAAVTPTPTKAEPSPIQLVQNMIHGLEATQNALEAAAAMRIDQTQIKGGKRSSSSSSNSSRGSSAGGCRVADRSGSTDMGYISKSPAGSTSGSEKKPSPDHSTSLDSVNLPLSSNSTAAESPAKKEMAPKLTVDTSEAMSRNSPSPGSSTVCSPGDLSGSASIMNTVVSASQHVHNMLAQSALMTTEEILRKSAPNQSNSHGVENDSLNSSFSSNSSFEAKSPASCQSRQSTPPRNSTPKGENKYKYKRRGVGARKSSTPTIASMLQMQAQGQPPMMMMGAQPPRGVVSQPHPILPQGSQQSFGTPPRLQYPGGQMRPGGMVNMGNNMAGQQLPFVSCMPVGQPAEQIMPRVHVSNAHMPTPKGPLPTASAESQNTGEQGNFYEGQGHFSYGANSVQGLNADMLQQFMHRQQQNIHMCVGQSQMPPVSSAASDQGHYEGQQEDQKGHETGQGHQLGQDQDISYQGFQENHETSLQGQHISEVKQEMFEMEGDQNRSHSTWIAGQQQQEQIAQQQSAFHQAAAVVPASGQESKHKYVDNSTVRSLKTEHQLPSNYITTSCSSSTYSPDAINGGESKVPGPAAAQSGVNHIQNQQQHDGQHSQAALHWPENAAVDTSQHIKGAEGGKWQLAEAVGGLPRDSMDEDHPVPTAMMNHHHDFDSNHTAKDEVDEELGPSHQGIPNTRVKEFSGMLTDGLTGTENFQQSGGEQCQDSKVKVYRTGDSSISNYVGKGQKRALVEEDETSECESEFSSMTKGMPASQRSFQVGDLVWGQVRGCPSWPGKLVNENEVRSNKCAPTEPGKFWVRWYGDHSFTQVEQDKLKTLSEGLEAHHSDGKKQRKGRKLNVNLEAAIQELMAELDRKTGTANC